MGVTPADVLAFWREAGPRRWFARDEAFDARFRERFLEAHLAASRRELDAWAESADGALALVILLDQLPRNVFRGSAHAFATDPLARAIVRRALAAGHDRAVDPALRMFFYLPLQHSEELADQELSVRLATEAGVPSEYALHHRDIVARFGRFPHRNAALGRESTDEERAFLASGGFSG